MLYLCNVPGGEYRAQRPTHKISSADKIKQRSFLTDTPLETNFAPKRSRNFRCFRFFDDSTSNIFRFRFGFRFFICTFAPNIY